MSLEKEHSPRKKAERMAAQERTEERSGDIDPALNSDLDLRAKPRDALLVRNTSRDGHIAVHETISRHQAQVRKFAGHAAQPTGVPLKHDSSYRQRFEEPHPEKPDADPSPSDARPQDGGHSDKFGKDGTADTGGSTSEPSPEQGSGRSRAEKQSRLHFTEDKVEPYTVTVTDTKFGRKLEKAQNKAERSAGKLEKARDKLPKKWRPKIRHGFDEQSNKHVKKLVFEKQVKSQYEHLRGPLVTRSVKAGVRNAGRFAHVKVFQVEHENVGVQAAHKAEILAEAGLKKAYRLRKTAPYRKVTKLETKTTKLNMKASYQKALNDNPKLRSNIFSRIAQKRKIKRQYAKAAREAKKAGRRIKSAGDAAKRIGRAVLRFVGRHPVMSIIIIGILLLNAIISGSFTSCSNIGMNIGGAVVATTYLAQDADMYAAEEAYAGMEADIQNELDNYETLHPGYDEYIFELDDIGHDPYVLMSILHALYDDTWMVSDVQGTLAMLFGRQYILTETVTAETRYRTVTAEHTDPYTGETYEVDELEEYEYYICTVELENFNLSHLPVYIMSEERLSRYAMLMSTLGNRPDLFPAWQYPNASTLLDFEVYDIPQAYLDADPRFAAIIAEANKYLGMPYVWGGSNPATSFDCSGYVSWVLNQTGWNIGRLGARGLHSMSANVPASQARPGDLVFFHNTYKAEFPDEATHVGIYVGDGMMVHCGNPIGYVSIETAYWQDHLLGFGRIY